MIRRLGDINGGKLQNASFVEGTRNETDAACRADLLAAAARVTSAVTICYTICQSFHIFGLDMHDKRKLHRIINGPGVEGAVCTYSRRSIWMGDPRRQSRHPPQVTVLWQVFGDEKLLRR